MPPASASSTVPWTSMPASFSLISLLGSAGRARNIPEEPHDRQALEEAVSPPLSGGEPASCGETERTRDQAPGHRSREVGTSEPPGPAPEVAERLLVERGVGGEPAHHARGEDDAHVGVEVAQHGQLHHRAEQKRTEQVHAESPVRKRRPEPSQGSRREEVARAGSGSAAQADDDEARGGPHGSRSIHGSPRAAAATTRPFKPRARR